MPTMPQHTLRKISGPARVCSRPIMAENRGSTTWVTVSWTPVGRARHSRPTATAAAMDSTSWASELRRRGLAGYISSRLIPSL